MQTRIGTRSARRLTRTIAAAVVAAAAGMVFAAGPVAAEAGSVDRTAFAGRLSSSDLAKWTALTTSQQREVLRILADPRVARGFSTGSAARAVSDTLGVSESHGTNRVARPMTATARAVSTTYEVHAWYYRNWTILGITYASTRLDYYYVTGSGVVLYDHYCTASYSNRVPLRSMSVQVNHYVSGGKGTCIATWTLTKVNFWTDTSNQGMRVNGAGIEATWGP